MRKTKHEYSCLEKLEKLVAGTGVFQQRYQGMVQMPQCKSNRSEGRTIRYLIMSLVMVYLLECNHEKTN